LEIIATSSGIFGNVWKSLEIFLEIQVIHIQNSHAFDSGKVGRYMFMNYGKPLNTKLRMQFLGLFWNKNRLNLTGMNRIYYMKQQKNDHNHELQRTDHGFLFLLRPIGEGISICCESAVVSVSHFVITNSLMKTFSFCLKCCPFYPKINIHGMA